MKAKDWLIHKLGGITLEDAYRERHNLIQYKQSNVITLQSVMRMTTGMPTNSEFIKRELALRLLDTIKENIEIKCVDIPEKDMAEYRGILRVVKVE